jgi:cysteine dioxygenase
MNAVRLRDLLLFLNQQGTSDFQGSAVDDYLTENDVELDDLLPFTRFREDTYARNLIHRTEIYELFVIAWLPGQKAAAHDHAGQRCWTSVALGELTFQDYKACDRDDRPPVPQGKPHKVEAGENVYIDDRMAIHSIANLGKRPALSLHLYAAPITHCRVFDAELKRFKQVELHCFPPPPEAEWNTEHPLLRE